MNEVKEREEIEEQVNKIHFNEAKRIKRQLNRALKDCLYWDDPNVPHRSKIVDGSILYEKIKTVVDGIAT